MKTKLSLKRLLTIVTITVISFYALVFFLLAAVRLVRSTGLNKTIKEEWVAPLGMVEFTVPFREGMIPKPPKKEENPKVTEFKPISPEPVSLKGPASGRTVEPPPDRIIDSDAKVCLGEGFLVALKDMPKSETGQLYYAESGSNEVEIRGYSVLADGTDVIRCFAAKAGAAEVRVYLKKSAPGEAPVLHKKFYIIVERAKVDDMLERKPVIYLYPKTKQEVNIRLGFKGKITVDYPSLDADRSWRIIAYPDGRIINLKDGKEYSYLFWEGMPEKEVFYDLSRGFVVKADDAVAFLSEALSKSGLHPKEYNEFIVYWLPRIKANKFTLIHFAGKEYEDQAPLEVSPKPDTVIRVFMVIKPLDKPIDVIPQELLPQKREGFTVVEWGGMEIK